MIREHELVTEKNYIEINIDKRNQVMIVKAWTKYLEKYSNLKKL